MISKIVNLMKNILQFSYIQLCDVLPWFYQDFKSENLHFLKSVLSSSIENTGPVTRDYAKSTQIRNETPL